MTPDRFIAPGPWLVYAISILLILCAGGLGRQLGL
jgi:hypothetical protein